jgi:hypothetical protein
MPVGSELFFLLFAVCSCKRGLSLGQVPNAVIDFMLCANNMSMKRDFMLGLAADFEVRRAPNIDKSFACSVQIVPCKQLGTL